MIDPVALAVNKFYLPNTQSDIGWVLHNSTVNTNQAMAI